MQRSPAQNDSNRCVSVCTQLHVNSPFAQLQERHTLLHVAQTIIALKAKSGSSLPESDMGHRPSRRTPDDATSDGRARAGGHEDGVGVGAVGVHRRAPRGPVCAACYF